MKWTILPNKREDKCFSAKWCRVKRSDFIFRWLTPRQGNCLPAGRRAGSAGSTEQSLAGLLSHKRSWISSLVLHYLVQSWVLHMAAFQLQEMPRLAVHSVREKLPERRFW